VAETTNVPLAPTPESTGAAPEPAAASTYIGANIELPACFYLGREYDLTTKMVREQPVMYDARDLTTHGVVVGMTGSGKTGLCISILEEAAIDSIPCIIIDPKGDLTNLLLQFPELDPKDFRRWLNPEDARQKGLSEDEYARQLAEKWRKGLADSGQTPQRVALLRDSGEWRVYTPGSEAGLPLSILQTFAAPRGKLPREDLNQRIDATTTALLGLTGIAADPVQSREHILIAQLLLHSWSKGKDLDLPQLITQIQTPPLNKIGAFDVETFYPEKDRLKLAVALNNILAAPSFSTWITGEPLDLGAMLTPSPQPSPPTGGEGVSLSPAPPAGKGQGEGKPRHLIFSIAHLEDSQRLFFLTLLLEEILSWTRKQTGTTSLHAIVYFDEVFGYLPPHPANPPTKAPLMTLLKQARAFGVGILLATQNPVDLDYKALSNAGSWFVGKLQTERDKARLVEGLQGVAAERGTLSDKNYLETVISALGSRIFLLHDVHRGQPLLFQSRHVLSFLSGPMTRDQIAELMEPIKQREQASASSSVGAGQGGSGASAPAPAAIPLCRRCQAELGAGMQFCPRCGEPLARSAARQQDQQFKANLLSGVFRAPSIPAAPKMPELPAEVAQFYLPVNSRSKPANVSAVVYQARLLGCAEVVFVDKKKAAEHRRPFYLLAVPPAAGQALSWVTAERVADTLASAPEAGARWAEVPESANTARKLKSLEKSFADYLYNSARLVIYENSKLGLVGQPGEDIGVFRERCRAAARQEAGKAIAEERARYQPKFEALGVTMPEGSGEQEKHGSSLLNLVNPFKLIGWLTSKPPAKDQGKVERLTSEWFAKQAAIYEKSKLVGEEATDNNLSPRRQDVQVVRFGLAWAPFWEVQNPAGGTQLVPAYR
jgi:hypothetical protein